MDQGQAKSGHQIGAKETAVKFHVREDVEFGIGEGPVRAFDGSNEGAHSGNRISIEIREAFRLFSFGERAESMRLSARQLEGRCIVHKRGRAAGVHHQCGWYIVNSNRDFVAAGSVRVADGEDTVIIGLVGRSVVRAAVGCRGSVRGREGW